MEPLLEVRDLRVRYRSRAGKEVFALEGINLRIAAGEILGVLGESGSGKSTLATSLLALFSVNATVEEGAVSFCGRNLLKLNGNELAAIRGKKIALIFQEPGTALHPTIRAGAQIEEVLRAHTECKAGERRRTARELLARVFPEDADRIYSSYPHQLSGGQRQRVAITQAIACGPTLLVADEPTASLDPVTQGEILDLLKRLQKELHLAILFITHSPELLEGFADRIAVMYGGRIMETGPGEELLRFPLHPYSKALLQCRPKLDEAVRASRGARLPVIPGSPPDLSILELGCVFEPRCPDRMERCVQWKPASTVMGEEQEVACLKFEG